MLRVISVLEQAGVEFIPHGVRMNEKVERLRVRMKEKVERQREIKKVEQEVKRAQDKLAKLRQS